MIAERPPATSMPAAEPPATAGRRASFWRALQGALPIGGPEWFFIVAVLLLATGLRFVGNTHGQPNPDYMPSDAPARRLPLETPIHPDEYFYVALPLHMAVTGYLNPRYYENSSLQININFAVFYLTGAAESLDRQDWVGRSQRQYAAFPLYVVTRVHSALGGVLAVAAAYAVTRRLAGRFAAGAAGLLAAVSFPLVQHGHYATASSLAAGLMTIALWASLASLQQRRFNGWLFALAGIAAGLAASTRYNAAAIAIAVGLVGLALVARFPTRRTGRVVLIGWLLMPCIFVVGTPGIVFDPDYFIRDFLHIVNQFVSTGEGFSASYLTDPWLSLWLHLRYLALFSLGIPATVAAFLGAGVLWSQRGFEDQPANVGSGGKGRSFLWNTPRLFLTIMLVYLAAYTLVVLRNVRPSYNDHMLVPIIPQLVVLSGVGAGWLYRRLRLPAWILAPTLMLALIALPLVPSVQLVHLWTQPDTRYVMQAWVYDHLPRGSRIHLSAPYNVPLDPAVYDWTQTYINDFTPVEDLRAQGVDYVILSDAWLWDIQRSHEWMSPDFRQQVADWYASFDQGAARIAWINRPRWTGDDWPLHTASYWHNPSLAVYCLNPEACADVR